MKLGWSTERDLESMLGQPALVADVLRPHEALLNCRTQPHERHAIVWCVNNHVALNQFREGGLNALYYEDLVNRPADIVPMIFRAVGKSYGTSVFKRLSRPSSTAHGSSASVTGEDPSRTWGSLLTQEQMDDVMEIVTAFGLDHLYEASGEPSGALPEPGASSSNK
jgi:hypothetical protein